MEQSAEIGHLERCPVEKLGLPEVCGLVKCQGWHPKEAETFLFPVSEPKWTGQILRCSKSKAVGSSSVFPLK